MSERESLHSSLRQMDAPFDGRTVFLLEEVGEELTKARAKFPRFNSPHEGWAVIREELDELWEHVKANDAEGSVAFAEAIQVAAMALRFAYDLSRLAEMHQAEPAVKG